MARRHFVCLVLRLLADVLQLIMAMVGWGNSMDHSQAGLHTSAQHVLDAKSAGQPATLCKAQLGPA